MIENYNVIKIKRGEREYRLPFPSEAGAGEIVDVLYEAIAMVIDVMKKKVEEQRNEPAQEVKIEPIVHSEPQSEG